jgi:hypothetical protein
LAARRTGYGRLVIGFGATAVMGRLLTRGPTTSARTLGPSRDAVSAHSRHPSIHMLRPPRQEINRLRREGDDLGEP